MSQSRGYPTFLLPEKAPNHGTQTIVRHPKVNVIRNNGTQILGISNVRSPAAATKHLLL
jgi:hypothetical protein